MRRVDSFTSASRAWRPRACSPPTPGRARGPIPPRTAAARSHQARSTPAAASGGAIVQSRSTPWRASQADRACSRSARASGSGSGRPGLELPAQRVERGELGGRDLVAGEPAERREQRLHAASSASTARVAAAAGLLISCARPAASVPSVTRDSALARRRLDRARGAVEPLDEVAAEREPRVGQLTQHVGRHPEHPARRSLRDRSRDRRRARPRPGTRRPSGRARPSARPRCPRGRRGGRRSMAPSTSTHQKSACSPSRNSSTPGSMRTSVPPSTSSASWSSVRPSKRPSGRRSSTRIRSSPGSGARGRPTSRPRRRPTRPASSSRAGRRRRRRRRARSSRGRTAAASSGQRRARSARQQVLTGDHEPLVVADDLGAEPVGARRGADEDEQPARRRPPRWRRSPGRRG